MKTSQHQEVLRKTALPKICRLRQTDNFHARKKDIKVTFSIFFLKSCSGIYSTKKRE